MIFKLKIILVCILSFALDISAVDLSRCQASIVFQLTNIFEGSNPNFHYSSCENIHDGRGYTAGIAGFTTGNGDAFLVLENYNKRVGNNSLSKYIPAKKYTGDGLTGFDGFCDAWKNASLLDIQFNYAQIDTSMTLSTTLGLKLPLCIGFVFDTYIQQGENYILKIVQSTEKGLAALNQTTPAKGGNETLWLTQFMYYRTQILATQTGWSKTNYRVNSYQYAFNRGETQFDSRLDALDNSANPITLSCKEDMVKDFFDQRLDPQAISAKKAMTATGISAAPSQTNPYTFSADSVSPKLQILIPSVVGGTIVLAFLASYISWIVTRRFSADPSKSSIPYSVWLASFFFRPHNPQLSDPHKKLTRDDLPAEKSRFSNTTDLAEMVKSYNRMSIASFVSTGVKSLKNQRVVSNATQYSTIDDGFDVIAEAKKHGLDYPHVPSASKFKNRVKPAIQSRDSMDSYNKVRPPSVGGSRSIDFHQGNQVTSQNSNFNEKDWKNTLNFPMEVEQKNSGVFSGIGYWFSKRFSRKPSNKQATVNVDRTFSRATIYSTRSNKSLGEISTKSSQAEKHSISFPYEQESLTSNPENKVVSQIQITNDVSNSDRFSNNPFLNSNKLNRSKLSSQIEVSNMETVVEVTEDLEKFPFGE
ncbi:hypothetical protein HK096_002527 [Nowakowskiella sp. JEL0078]|nr:hypothetical protein HK096_002527 [Nowakowskiella sp. JEL0078]